MQRLAEFDLSGYLLTNDFDSIVHLFLPERFESDRRCTTVIGFEDPRQRDGELLWPARFDEKWATETEKSIGPYGWCGQFQQRPAPRGGGIIQRECWNTWENDKFPKFSMMVACLDTALTEEMTNDPSALVLLGVWENPLDGFQNVMLVHAWRKWLQLGELATQTKHTCDKYRVDRLLIENRTIGLPVYNELRKHWGGQNWGLELIEASRGRGGKEVRVNSVSHLFEEGMVWAPNRPWATEVIDEVSIFPKGVHDDLCDALIHSLRWLRDAGILSRKKEQRQRELREDFKSDRSSRKALYSV